MILSPLSKRSLRRSRKIPPSKSGVRAALAFALCGCFYHDLSVLWRDGGRRFQVQVQVQVQVQIASGPLASRVGGHEWQRVGWIQELDLARNIPSVGVDLQRPARLLDRSLPTNSPTYLLLRSTYLPTTQTLQSSFPSWFGYSAADHGPHTYTYCYPFSVSVQ